MRAFIGAIVAGAALAAFAAVGAEGDPAAPRAIEGQPRFQPPGQYLMLPAYSALAQESVQKQIELVHEQKEKLREISRKYLEEIQGAGRLDWSKWGEMSQEERKAKIEEMQKRYSDAQAAAKKAIEEVLLPHQIDRLKQIEFRTRASGMLYAPNVIEQIGLTEEQKNRLKQLREEQQKKMAALMEETMEKTLDLLNDEQRKKLEELSNRPWQGFQWGGGQRP